MRGIRFGTWVIAAGALGACTGSNPSTVATAVAPPVPDAQLAPCERRHPGVGAQRVTATRDGSSVALARLGDTDVAYIADGDDDALYTVALDGSAATRTALGGAPAEVVVFEDGRVAVTLRDVNRVRILEPVADAVDVPLAALCSAATPAEPVGLALTPAEDEVVVASGWGRSLTRLSSRALDVQRIEKLEREPRDVVVEADGRRAFVSHVVGGTVSVVDLDRRSDARSIDLSLPKKRTPGRRSSCQGFALAKTVSPGAGEASSRIFAPRVSIESGDAIRPTPGGYGEPGRRLEAPVINVVDAAAERSITRELTETGHRKGECLLPRAATVAGERLLVACQGSDRLVSYDARTVDPTRVPTGRYKIPAGATGVAALGTTGAVVFGQFDRDLAVLDLTSGKRRDLSLPAPQKAKLTALEAKGRRLFHQTDDARISGDGRACASCHPDGREDALTWPTPNGPRQTVMLAGRIRDTAPYSWQGDHASLKEHVKHTLQRLGGFGMQGGERDQADLAALLAYVNAMPGPRTQGALVSPQTQRLAKVGEALFYSEELACGNCHQGGGTDAERHRLASVSVDTPSLRFVGGTAPYFHDGRYASLLEVVTQDSSMAHTHRLSHREAEALVAFLETQ